MLQTPVDVEHAEETFSETERWQPYALNAATLATRGVDTLGGVLQRGLPFDVGTAVANRLLGLILACFVYNARDAGGMHANRAI